MQRISIRPLSVAMIAICAITASVAQPVVSLSYLDRDYHPASATSYAYKRVIKANGEVLIPHLKVDIHGNQTWYHTGSGSYACSLTDYFPSGEPAMVANVTSTILTCDHFAFDGKVVYFYRGGGIRKTEFYKYGKLQGDVIASAEDGRVVTKEHYEGGQIIDTDKYKVAPNHPLVGKWKAKDCVPYSGPVRTCLEYVLLWTISSNGILDTQILRENPADNQELQTNWKYTSTGPGAGTLEEFQGETLAWRGDIRWISGNAFDYTTTFSPDPNSISQRLRFVREWRDGIR